MPEKAKNNKKAKDKVRSKTIDKNEEIDNSESSFNYKIFFSEKSIQIYGLIIILFSIFLFFSSFSYLFTWKEDQDLVESSWWNLLIDNSTQARNLLGKLGAIFSHILMHRWFGITSFLLIFILFLIGVRISFKKTIIKFKPLFIHTLFCIFWLPTLMALISGNKPEIHFLAGNFGYYLNMWISLVVGKVGMILLLFTSLLIFLIVNYRNFCSQVIKKIATKLQTSKISQEQENTVKYQNIESKEVDKIESEEEIFIKNEVSINNRGEEEKINVLYSEKTNIDEEKINLDESNEITFTIENNSQILETTESEEENAEKEKEEEHILAIEGDFDPTLDLPHYKMPDPELLIDYEVNNNVVTKEELTANKDKIVNTLKDYGIIIEHIHATIGPSVTLYEIIPKAGTRISKIQNLERDIALSLAALGIRIIAPMPGRGTIGIEVPNSRPQIVSMKSIITSEKFQNCKYDLPIGLGKTISNEIYIADLTKMPHLLMAGATGQGKSVGINAILTSLLYKKHPALLKFVLVDPKKVELTLYNRIEKHYLAKLPDEEEAIVVDVKKALKTLNSLCKEMDNRYELLKKAEVRNIKEYNAKFLSRQLNPNIHRFLPYIVLVIDEFADLIMTAGREVELPIARLAQLARAIGIHLIIATQRPSVNIITGIIKANFPARMAFRVTSKIDSRTILDAGGAEQLIGRGDMLLSTGSDLIRLQCPFIDTPEVAKLTEFISSQQGFPNAFYLPEVADENVNSEGKDIVTDDIDPLFDEAARLIVANQIGSTSLIQRKMKLGYNRAGRIMDQLEAAGIVGPSSGSKAREVLVKSLDHLEQILQSRKK